MATATLTTTSPQSPPASSTFLNPNNFMSNIDMTTLTQTELSTLSSLLSPPSLSSSSSDLPVPSIDSSVFNESAGSRRQTYSRPSSTHHRHRIAGNLIPSHHHHHQPSLTSAAPTVVTDDSPNTNHLIISSLKQLLSQDPRFSDIEFASPRPHVPPPPPLHTMYQLEKQSFTGPFVRKKKRGRKPKPRPGFEAESEMGLEIVNKHGHEVDVLGLGSLEDPFRDEIRRRTDGMGNEEMLLQFLSELGGQWCSRRRKRKFVDAGVIGDILPIGWKLLLGLKRKEGNSWVYVRRYVSPGGRQFGSCKEISEYLQSYFRIFDVNGKIDHGGDSAQQVYKMAFVNPADVMQEDDQKQLNENEIKHTLLEDNLKDVQVLDIFECHKCNRVFDEKDSYLEHFLSFHQKSAKKLKVGSTVGDGVIIRDGKFECQFCHKVFDERRRYSGHVGIHVRNYVRGVGELPGVSNLPRRIDSPVREALPVSKMDALIEIAKTSISETSAGPDDSKCDVVLTSAKQIMEPEPKITASTTSEKMNKMKVPCSLNETEIEDCINETKSSEELYQQNTERMIIEQGGTDINCSSSALNVTDMDTAAVSINVQNLSVGENDPTLTVAESGKSDIELMNSSDHSLAKLSDHAPCVVEHNMNVDSTGIDEHPTLSSIPDGIEVGTFDHEKMEVDIDFESLDCETASHVDVDIVKLASNNGLPESSLNGTPFKVVEPENVANFDGMGFDAIEHLQFSFGNEQESLFLTDVPVGANNVNMESTFGSSSQFETTEEVMLDVTGGHQHLTECVWCGIQFSHAAVDTEEQSGSVGYMCPSCKIKISGQFN